MEKQAVMILVSVPHPEGESKASQVTTAAGTFLHVFPALVKFLFHVLLVLYRAEPHELDGGTGKCPTPGSTVFFFSGIVKYERAPAGLTVWLTFPETGQPVFVDASNEALPNASLLRGTLVSSFLMVSFR